MPIHQQVHDCGMHFHGLVLCVLQSCTVLAVVTGVFGGLLRCIDVRSREGGAYVHVIPGAHWTVKDAAA